MSCLYKIIKQVPWPFSFSAWVVTRSTTNTTSALNSLHWLPIQQRINIQLATLCPPFTPQRWPSIHVIFTTCLCAIVSALLCRPQSPLPTSYQHCSCHSWFSTCWPFPMEFPPSLSKIYWLLHCLQIQSKNSPFLCWKHIWPPVISIHALLIRHNHVDFCALKFYYVHLTRKMNIMLCSRIRRINQGKTKPFRSNVYQFLVWQLPNLFSSVLLFFTRYIWLIRKIIDLTSCNWE